MCRRWNCSATGGLPWITLVLAFSFGFYGLVRKMVQVDSLQGLFIETLLLAPFAYIGIAWLAVQGSGSLFQLGIVTDVLLVAAGIFTSVPLLLFTMAARRLPLTTIGFMQYLAPTIGFLIAVFLFREPFGAAQLVAFAFIWAAVALYVGGLYWVRQRNLPLRRV